MTFFTETKIETVTWGNETPQVGDSNDHRLQSI